MKRLLVVFYICLVFCNVCYGSIDRKCKEGDPNCVDFDYHFEEAAKEMVLDHSNKSSFTSLSELTIHGRTNATNVSDNESLKKWWKEWYHATMQLHKIDPDQYARPLCKPFRMKEKFMECNETSRTQACIETRNMNIVQCDGSGDSQFLIPICKEKSSNRVVTCGVLSTFVCYSFEENKPRIKPCYDTFQQICLSRNGSLVKCTQANFLSNLNVESLLKNTIKDTPVWWRKGKRPNLELEEKYSGNESVTLCLSNKAKDQLRYCNETETRTTACFNTSSGELAGCKHFRASEMIVPICSEVSSNKIQSCDKSKKEFLCFSPGNVKKPIQNCENGGHHICLNSNGLLDKCSNYSMYDKSNQSSEKLANTIINSSKAWEDWWTEWVSNIPVTEEEDDIFLCKSNEKLMKCDQRLSDLKACVSAKSGKIDLCEKLNERDLLITLCTKGSMNKIISCSDYGSAYLCFDRNSKRNFIRPCRSENRHLCLTDAGLVKSCSALNPPEESGISGNITLPKDGSLHWNRVWEVLFPITYGLENNLTEDKALCITKDEHIFECLDTSSGNIACVGAKAGKIGDCMSMQSKESPVPICREKSSDRVVVCGDRSLFPCESSDGKSSFYYPCKSPLRQLCLTHDGLLEKCQSRSVSENSGEMELHITSTKVISIIKTTEGFKSDDLKYLCKNGSVVLACSDRFLYPKACLNTKIGKIQSCENIERYFTIGLPVCIHVNTSKLFTCGEYSQSALCFPRSGKMHPLNPCKMNVNSACITAEGKLVKCTKSLQNVSQFYDEKDTKDTPTSLIERESIRTEYEQESITPLCMQQDTDMAKECESDPTINFACLSSKKGVMHFCLHAKPYNLSIPLCLKGESKAVVTCGKFNHVNLCQDKKRSIYRPCNRIDDFVCFKNGLISRCQAKYFNYMENDRYSTKFVGDLKEAEGYQVSGYQNSKKVYEFESRSIQARLKNCVRLCEVYEDKNVLRSCDDDPSINFACFGVNEGTVKSCSSFGPTELIMPVCVEKSKRVVTHGKFFKTYLCFQDNGDGVRIDTCRAKNEHICLTKKGFLEKCDHNEVEISFKLRKGNQKGEASSTEQSTIKSEFNANLNKTLTSKENEMFEDHSEEITNEDYTEKLKAILGMKSNKKSSRVSNSKQNYNAESDKEQEEPLKNAKNEKKENKNHEDEKRKDLKKNNKKNKEQKVAKKPKKVNSDSRIRKSINEYNNVITTEQSMGELRDSGDKYEYYLHNSNNAEKLGNESNEQNDSDINVEEFLKSMHLVYQDLLQEYKIKHRQAIIEKELRQISSIHMISRHLCKVRKDSDKLVDCDNDPHLRFACVGAREGKLRRCNEFKKTDVPFPVCFQANSRNLVTCDIFSNVQLNLMGSDHEACLGDNGLPVECGNHITRRSSSMEQFQVPHPDDEKFYRLLCTNCSIENRFILEGSPQDVLPTLEVFTYPPK